MLFQDFAKRFFDVRFFLSNIFGFSISNQSFYSDDTQDYKSRYHSKTD